MVDLIIIGAGPIGIALAIGARQARLSMRHFDKGQLGQTITQFPRQMQFFSSNDRISLSGVPIQTADQGKCSREEYLAYLRMLVVQFGLKLETFSTVTAVNKVDGGYTVRVVHQGKIEIVSARRIVFVTGGTAKVRTLEVDGVEMDHVAHHFSDPHRYFQKNVMIIGGKNSAIEAALKCHHSFASVSICYRQKAFSSASIKYWLLPEITGLIKEGKIKVYYESIVHKIMADAIVLKHIDNGEVDTVPVDQVLVQIGFDADMSLLEQAGITMSGDGMTPTYCADTMETNMPYLYVAGTAIAGTQNSYQVFLENCHIHVTKILAHITGQQAPEDAPLKMIAEA